MFIFVNWQIRLDAYNFCLFIVNLLDNREKIKLPDGTERNWTEKSYLVLASSKEIFLISAKKTTIPKLNEDAINWGWILFEDGIPVKWGNNTKARIYKLPNPEIFSWGD